MKNIVLVTALSLMGVTFTFGQYAVEPHMTDVSFGVFYSSLDGYGEWIPLSHGLYGWRPLHVMTGWRPYTFGRWVWTDDGWYWASDEPWAWAVYHYGRWHYDDDYGWIWIPGDDWAPAWVEWRFGGDYIGWAPLSPYAVFTVNVGIRYEYGWETPNHYWCFADARYITSPHIDRYVYRTPHNWRFLRWTGEGGNVVYRGGRIVTRGPERDFIERRTGHRLERAEIVNVSDRSQQQIRRDGGRERIQVYRPDTGGRAAGRNVTRPERVREPERPLSIDVRRTDAGSRMAGRREESTLRPDDRYRKRVEERGNGLDRLPVPESRAAERRPEMGSEIPRAPESRVHRPIPEARPSPSYQVPEPRSNRDVERRAPVERPAPSFQAAPRPLPQVREERRVAEPRGNERPSRTDERRSERER
jgi:hypothetical protein